jgi:ATP-dependent RNA helicase DDX24/MAK5
VKQERLLRSCPPVVVATPGRLWDLIRHGHKHVSDLEQLSFFVLDEADRMVQQVGALVCRIVLHHAVPV